MASWFRRPFQYLKDLRDTRAMFLDILHRRVKVETAMWKKVKAHEPASPEELRQWALLLGKPTDIESFGRSRKPWFRKRKKK